MEPAAFRFAISATFTAEPLEPVFRFWERWFGTPLEVRFAPYHQVHQTLAQFASEFAINRQGVNIVLARIEDLAGFDWNDPGIMPRLQQNFVALLSQLRNAPEAYRVPLIFVLCPPSPEFAAEPSRALLCEQLARQAQQQLTPVPGLHYLSHAQIEELYFVLHPFSAEGERLGRVPYTTDYFCALGTALVRLADGLIRLPYKLIALDCDNTLWRGICGEDGPAAVLPLESLQRFMLRQRQAGMLLAIVSRNNEQDVLDTFAAHPDMPLQLSHFAGRRVNWNSKAANLKELAAELSLGTGSFVFVDDNARETAEVEGALPEVLALTAPEQDVDRYLSHVWALDHWSATDEDRLRNASITGVQEFGRERKAAEDLQHFMDSLDLQLSFSEGTREQLPRMAQLTQRSNQFNFTTVRRSEAELAQDLSQGLHALTVEVSDRFGSYGLTGLVLYRIHQSTLHVDTFLLSCRVLGRGVEHRVLAQLAAEATHRGAAEITVSFTENSKNRPAKQFLDSLENAPDASGLFRWSIHAAASIRWAPDSAPAPEPAAAAVSTQHRRPDYQTIALTLNTVEQIVVAMSRSETPLAPDPTLNTTETRLAAIWASLLGNSNISASSNFFDLGGHSLLMVQMVMRVREAFGVELAVDDVYSATLTLSGLARKIDGTGLESAEYLALLREVEAMSDEEVERLLREEQPDA